MSLDDAQEARRLVQQITDQHGYISPEETRDAIPDPEKRRKFELAMLRKDQMIGSTVITLAKNLYSSKARFVLEMLQNADDNSYRNARSAGQQPYVSFAVYPDRIVVECNEDGFDSDNLSAICSVGKSSKTVAQGYIGEKGIGFKSVFMVAWKAHIQSRAFSFSFTHRRNDSGLGMISPVWEEAATGPLRGVTRITLSLHEEAISGDLRQSVNDQFANLQKEFLLFMKNLRRVSVEFFERHDLAPYSSISYTISRPQPNRAVVQTVTNNGSSTTESALFHITKVQATNLPRNENRQYSDAELAVRAYSTAEIILAFPLTTESEPIIQAQNLFVFLPVRAVGFSFIIQADFVTDASRQDIVSESPRNRMLVAQIAKAFAFAVSQFCHHPPLLYKWMRYLPPRNDQHRGSLWSTLVDKLAMELATTPALVGRRTLQLYRISDLVRPTQDVLDQNNEPLFLDSDSAGSLTSSTYAGNDLDTLQTYGLNLPTYQHVLRWVREDLVSLSASRIRSTDMPDDWYTRFARLLKRPFLDGLGDISMCLKAMDIVPLVDGTWVSTNSCLVYSTCVNGLEIPSGLGLCILSPQASNAELLDLYRLIGVRKAPVALVQENIRRLYASTTERKKITLKESKTHLRFLYQSCNHNGTTMFKPEWLMVIDSKGLLRSPTNVTVYIQNNDPYGPWELFRQTDPGTYPGAGAPGFQNVSFLHQDYFQPMPEPSTTLSWTDWLKTAMDLKDDVHFNSFEGEGGLQYLQKYRPEKFLGALRESHMKFGIPDGIVNQLQRTDVLCKGNLMKPLQQALFPTIELEKRFERYVGAYDDFPWLWIHDAPETGAHQIIPDAWKSLLEALQVGIPHSDVNFALEMLVCVTDKASEHQSPENVERVFELYRHIASRLHESCNRSESEKEIREVFEEEPCLFVPDGQFVDFVLAEQCVWRAPAVMESKFVLSLLWKDFFQDGNDAQFLSSFFKNIVGVSNCTYDTYVDELIALKDSDCNDIDIIKVWYKALDRSRGNQGPRWDELRKPFVDEPLIYLPLDGNGDSWHAISDCVWSSTAKLRNKASLSEEYSDLEGFFVDFLGVRRLDLEMAVSELKDAGRRLAFTDLKASIWTINSLLGDEELRENWLEQNDTIFPVRESDGSMSCVCISSQFFIVDRDYEWRAFKGRVRFLDYSLEEVAKLRPFMRWANLESRLLSRCVREFTSLGDTPTELVLDKEQQIANRAHALLRIAIQAGSPRAQTRQCQEALYSLLQNAQIYRTDGVASGIQLSQDGENHMADGKSVAVYLWEDDTSLKVYLPKDRKQRKHAFNTLLPKKFIEWLMTNPTTQILTKSISENLDATKDVFTTDPSMLGETLQNNGIATIDIENRDNDEQSETASTIRNEDELGLDGLASLSLGNDDGITLSDNTSTVSGPIGRDRSTVYTPTGSTEVGEPEPTILPTSSERRSGNSRLQPFHQQSSPFELPMRPASSLLTPSEDSEYVELLQAVITTARRATLPMSNAPEVPINDEQRFRFRHTSQIERDCKVGAAGELYVFELLSHIGLFGTALPAFSRSNWQSNVRKYVRTHPEYSDLDPWDGPETSDIVYHDFTGALTSRLVDAGYLDRQFWALPLRRPRYYIEVKATTSSCETPFYMSKAQYARMEQNVLSQGRDDTVYVIFRVYNLSRASMGLKIYMDPETLRRNGSLIFTAEQWSVAPATS